MNMLDNALEACGKITDKEQRHIQFRSEIKNDFLTISCKNTFSEKPKKDRHGRIITSKSDALSHGFGIRQMESIAQKYHSILDISYEMGAFIATMIFNSIMTTSVSYSLLYGSLASLFVFLLYLYIVWYILMVSAEVT